MVVTLMVFAADMVGVRWLDFLVLVPLLDLLLLVVLLVRACLLRRPNGRASDSPSLRA